MSLAISVDNLSKAYQLGQFGTGTISRDIERWWITTIRGKEDPFLKIGEKNDRSRKGETDIVWALHQVSFQVQQGEVLGIIGKNGAGKSTLLKILSRTTSPTKGEIKIKGRIASLLEVGTGFHPELTGRENIFLNGAILGMTTREIRKKFDEIVDFSGVERYIDTPVKRYSSGMYVRLAFAVAAHLEPEILVVDEVLAVGDAEFQKKCLGKIKEVSVNEGRTVLFVSHNMSAIANLCSSALVLNSGTVRFLGTTELAVQNYQAMFYENKGSVWVNNNQMVDKSLLLKTVKAELEDEQPSHRLIVSIEFVSSLMHKDLFIAFDISNGIGVVISQSIPKLDNFIRYSSNNQKILVELDLPPLIPDVYSLSVWIGSHYTETIIWEKDIVRFEINSAPMEGRTFPYSSDHGFMIVNSRLISYEETN